MYICTYTYLTSKRKIGRKKKSNIENEKEIFICKYFVLLTKFLRKKPTFTIIKENTHQNVLIEQTAYLYEVLLTLHNKDVLHH